MTRYVAVVGAGASGLTAVKCCVDEGLEPICFEKSNDVGGLWHYDEQGKGDRTTVMECTVANVSKELTSYSDFPVPKEFPMYMPATCFYRYLRMYAEKFDLVKYINFRTEVITITETDDHMTTGQWKVKVRNVASGDSRDYLVNAVLVCVGVNRKAVMPDFPGSDKFSGKMVHTRDYRNCEGFEGKRAVVVGMGNSAADVACDICDKTEQVYISARSGGWLVTRQAKNGEPVDFMAIKRTTAFLLRAMPALVDKIFVKKCNQLVDHEKYGLCPKYSPSRSNVVVSDEISFKLMSGKIKIKSGIKEITERDVIFADGSKVTNVDIIVFATGYSPEVTFLRDDVIGSDFEQLYLTMFPRKRNTSTLAVIGNLRVKGAVVNVLEMQARYATRVFKGNIKLPGEDKMAKWVEQNIADSRSQRLYSLRGVPQVDYIAYMDKLASQIGCKPNIVKLLLTDFELGKKLLFEPSTSYQYRLCGPGAWLGARDAIMGQIQRTYYPLTDGRYVFRQQQGLALWKPLLLLAFVAVILSKWLLL